MLNSARFVVLRLDLPQFLEANAISLRLTVLPQIELGVQLLGQMTMTTLGKYCALGTQLHTTCEGILSKTKCKINLHVAIINP